MLAVYDLAVDQLSEEYDFKMFDSIINFSTTKLYRDHLIIINILSLSCITLLHEALHQASRKKELSVLFCTIYVFKLLKFLEHTPHNYGIQKYCDQSKSVRVSMQVTNPALATVDMTPETY